ncbi:hypothetical protein [Bradyrhizobium genosp. A]|uniref:hypothetical protein n=1 Tax=Bradyrhizobium genosp. A TaxID=83626 RepID=UPI003CF1F1BA
MDEPFWFGHSYSGKNACRSSVQDLASRVAINVRIFTAAFPNVVVGDIEPFPAISRQPRWQAEYAAWVAAFRAATGVGLDFLQLDFDWWNPDLIVGQAQFRQPNDQAIANLARQVSDVARQNELKLGMIMNGGGPPGAHSDSDWVQQARAHIRVLEGSGVHFDHALIETWDRYPSHTLPETDPNSLSSLIGIYRQTHHR